MTKQLNQIEKEINKYVNSAVKSLKSYRDNIQVAYEIRLKALVDLINSSTNITKEKAKELLTGAIKLIK